MSYTSLTSRSARLLLCMALASGGIACGQTILVTTPMGEVTAVQQFRNFSLLLPSEEELTEHGMSSATLQRLAELCGEEMQRRGYEGLALTEADLIIALSPGVRSFAELRTYTRSIRPEMSVGESTFAEGSLVLTFVDKAAKQVVLKREAKTRIQDGVSDEVLREAVTQLFEGVPRAPSGAAS